jgi:hypothetical protein
MATALMSRKYGVRPAEDFGRLRRIRDRLVAPKSPWRNSHVERAIGSIRRELPDQVIVLSEAYVRNQPAAYQAY